MIVQPHRYTASLVAPQNSASLLAGSTFICAAKSIETFASDNSIVSAVLTPLLTLASLHEALSYSNLYALPANYKLPAHTAANYKVTATTLAALATVLFVSECTHKWDKEMGVLGLFNILATLFVVVEHATRSYVWTSRINRYVPDTSDLTPQAV